MKDITITCDRCGKIVHGGIDETVVPSLASGPMTAGYYIVEVGCWSQFARWEETKICDACMHSDPKYLEVYPPSKDRL